MDYNSILLLSLFFSFYTFYDNLFKGLCILAKVPLCGSGGTPMIATEIPVYADDEDDLDDDDDDDDDDADDNAEKEEW